MHGAAPDAQVLVMKVFGDEGGAYDSDYTAAIEDAIVLGADTINLSLGSASPGPSKARTEAYQKIFDDLENASSVSSILLTTEACVADKPEPPAHAAPASMGGMDGMY